MAKINTKELIERVGKDYEQIILPTLREKIMPTALEWHIKKSTMCDVISEMCNISYDEAFSLVDKYEKDLVKDYEEYFNKKYLT